MSSSTVLMYEQLPTDLRDAIERSTTRTLCPMCDGGRSHEYSLSIRQAQDGVISMRCFRSSCNWFGLTLPNGDVKFQTKRIKQAVYYREPTEALGDGNYAYLAINYGLDRQTMNDHGWRQNGTTLVMPVLSPYGQERGHVTRTFDKPKRCYTYKATAQPWLDWWDVRDDDESNTVIVEDCLSACRLSGLGYNAVALLGTSISVPQAQEIAKHSVGVTHLALDRDAFDKALKLAKRHSHILNMRPVCLDEDIKNIPYDKDIRALFM